MPLNEVGPWTSPVGLSGHQWRPDERPLGTPSQRLPARQPTRSVRATAMELGTGVHADTPPGDPAGGPMTWTGAVSPRASRHGNVAAYLDRVSETVRTDIHDCPGTTRRQAAPTGCRARGLRRGRDPTPSKVRPLNRHVGIPCRNAAGTQSRLRPRREETRSPKRNICPKVATAPISECMKWMSYNDSAIGVSPFQSGTQAIRQRLLRSRADVRRFK